MSGFTVQSIRSLMIAALAATIGVALAAGALAEQTAGTPEPIMSRQMSFAIPFTVDHGAAPGTRPPAEVRLYVAGDRDRAWRLYATAQPGQRRFMFRAPAEGEYRFRIVTVQHSGDAVPTDGDGSRLRVIVDTTAPRLQLEAARGDAGQVSARWTIEEPHFEPEGATLQYRAGRNGPWQTVAVPPAAYRVDGTHHVGEITWWPQPGHGPIQVRMEILDTAGNRTISNAALATSGPTAAGTGTSVSWPADRRVDTPPAAQSDIPTRVVDSRLFELEYDLSAVAAEDVASVELWATRDGGQTWQPYQADQDHRSPLLVRVNEDGWYGFRIVIRRPNGQIAEPPLTGQQPDILVRVDTQPAPVASISSGHGQGPDTGSPRMQVHDLPPRDGNTAARGPRRYIFR